MRHCRCRRLLFFFFLVFEKFSIPSSFSLFSLLQRFIHFLMYFFGQFTKHHDELSDCR